MRSLYSSVCCCLSPSACWPLHQAVFLPGSSFRRTAPSRPRCLFPAPSTPQLPPVGPRLGQATPSCLLSALSAAAGLRARLPRRCCRSRRGTDRQQPQGIWGLPEALPPFPRGVSAGNRSPRPRDPPGPPPVSIPVRRWQRLGRDRGIMGISSGDNYLWSALASPPRHCYLSNRII